MNNSDATGFDMTEFLPRREHRPTGVGIGAANESRSETQLMDGYNQSIRQSILDFRF
ncbi:MAG: hypothetical protein U7126_09510 [Microcoleus sp.]